MITQAASSSCESFFERFYVKDAFNRQSDYHLFKDAFRSSLELVYIQRSQILANVIEPLKNERDDLVQRICKFAAKCGISLEAVSSDEAALAFIENIIAGLKRHPFSSKKCNSEFPGASFCRVQTSSEAARQATIEKGLQNFRRQECVRRLVPFIYELIHRNSAFNVLDKTIEAFHKCSIELNKEALIKIHEEYPQDFIVEFSTQLCSSDLFLEDNAFEAVKYCFPNVKEKIPDFLNCLSRINLQNFSFAAVRSILDEVFAKRYKELSQHIIEATSSNSLLIRAALAVSLFWVDSNTLAWNFLNLFSEEEIFFDREFSSLLDFLRNALVYRMNDRDDKTALYFGMINCYLTNWMIIHRRGKSGSERIKLMLEEQEAGKPFSIDRSLPKDTPLWRECGFLEASINEVKGVARIFKLDWDFDIWNSETSYAKMHEETIKSTGMSDELYRVLFPALVTLKSDMDFPNWWEAVLGYSFTIGPSGVYMTLPEPATVVKRWNKVLEDPRAKNKYRELAIAETEGTSTIDEFIDLFMKYDVICSKTSEFVHDHQYHLLATIRVIMNSSAEAYLNSLKCAREDVKEAQLSIRKAYANPEFATDPTMLKILEITLGIFVDVYLIKKTVDNRNYYYANFFAGKKVLSTWRGADGDRWRHVFREFNISHDLYPAIRIQEYWDRIIRKRDELTFDPTPLVRE